MVKSQRRGRRLMMSGPELDAFLTAQRVCRLATTGPDGRPHISPLWFLWHDGSLWLYSLTRSRRWADLRQDARAAAVVDDGVAYGELRGAELSGTVGTVGEVPRTGACHDRLTFVERLFAEKYFGTSALPHDGRHAWLRLRPESVVSWDFRKAAHPDGSTGAPGGP
ncbi:pyridoxamine 5'-phosphate oxidase family protein [Streptomyces orinoci]|uniref:Pyridoxamine 5'-phosphate oxidase family protein n=1 Tax=Streptomyces orinoci TaxID=67339 RepID=A0ABV3K139_STRON|nr:pyridoxamine 5'-phosphate oxidase family protein [Streptomyces orinoci]